MSPGSVVCIYKVDKKRERERERNKRVSDSPGQRFLFAAQGEPGDSGGFQGARVYFVGLWLNIVLVLYIVMLKQVLGLGVSG